MNWRKPLIFAGLYLSRNKIPEHLKEIKEIERLSQKEIKKYQGEKLRRLLLHSYKNVPYYKRVLNGSGVIVDEEVNLENFDKITTLNKETIRREGKNLYSRDYKKRDYYINTSGGSTGEPVQFIQDDFYKSWNWTNKFYYDAMIGKDVGEPEIKLWGSERDIFEGSETLMVEIQNKLYNRLLLNSFMMSKEDMRLYVRKFNSFRPKSVWAYVESIYELAKFIDKNNLKIHSPESIIVTAGTLYPGVREYVELIFKTNVHNQYGSREVGAIACECTRKRGMHVFEHTHLVEILDDEGKPVKPNEMGEIYVTLLINFSMPLIRYKIGDIGAWTPEKCACGRIFPTLKNITGRITDHFKRKDGTLIHGQYFIHLFYNREGIKKFQVIQMDYDLIVCKIVLEKNVNNKDLLDIERKIKLVMGEDCRVKINFVDEIEPSKSGKYLYTISEVAD